METAMSCILYRGAQDTYTQEGDNDTASQLHFAPDASESKIVQANRADEHTLVKFFRKRIPCSCLDEKYQEVKQITQRLAFATTTLANSLVDGWNTAKRSMVVDTGA
jgi:hypothetical protein